MIVVKDLNGDVINIGPWESIIIIDEDGNTIDANPLPEGAYETEEDVIETELDGRFTTASLAASIRNERNALLAASDWTQIADAPVDQSVWATYRQALRDVTLQEGFPVTILWPSIPL